MSMKSITIRPPRSRRRSWRASSSAASQVGLERGFLDVGTLGGTTGVDVDGDQRFGVVDDDGAARRQVDLAAKAVSIWCSIWKRENSGTSSR
jgi:hypothetical protein